MADDRNVRIGDLHDIVDQKITSLVREMEATNWSAEEIVLAINDVLKVRWLDRIEAQSQAAASFPKTFVSDGNEG